MQNRQITVYIFYTQTINSFIEGMYLYVMPFQENDYIVPNQNEQNEYVVYNQNQQQMKYLVEFSIGDEDVKDVIVSDDAMEYVDDDINDVTGDFSKYKKKYIYKVCVMKVKREPF